MKSFKTIAVVVIALAVMAVSISAFACANDVFVGFDQIPNAEGEYEKIYKCPLEKGRVYTDGAAEKVEWKHAFYEADYPHRAIETLILDDQETGYLRFDGEYADVNTKEVPEFWESKAPYFVYNRVYSDFTGAFEPTNVLKTDYVTAPVAKDWVNKGFDVYVKTEDGVVDYSKVYADNAEKVDVAFGNFEALYNAYQDKIIAGIDAEGKPVYTEAFVKGYADDAYEVFEHAINNVSWLELTGPNYADGGEMKFFPIEKIADGSDAAWYDELLVSDNKYAIKSFGDKEAVGFEELVEAQDNIMKHLGLAYEDHHADIEWKVAGYELVAPYRVFEVLYVNGVPMDGSFVDVVNETVEKEEIVEINEDFADEIHYIEKAIEKVGETTESKIDYVITPFDAKAVKFVDTTVDYKVIENPLLEKRLAEVPTAFKGPQYEVRFVKVNEVANKSRLPYIWRYNGATADPVIEWKVVFAEAEAPYEIYEEKYVDGIRTYEYRTTGEYADDMPSVSTVAGQPRVLTVKLSADVDGAKLEQALIDAEYEFVIGGDRVIVIVPAELYPGFEITEEGQKFAFELDEIIASCTPNVQK